MKTFKTKSKKLCGGGIVLSVVAAAALTLTPAVISPHIAIAAAADREVIGGNYFVSDYDSRSEVVEAGKGFASELIGEGTVLLKNAALSDGSKALPLTVTAGTDTKISLFGKNAYYDPNFVTVLEKSGFKVNPAVKTFYNTPELSGSGAPGYPGNGVVLNGYPTGESDISKFNDSNNSVGEYNQAAIVTFTRWSGEGYDLPRSMAQVNGDYKVFGKNAEPVDGARAVDDHNLQLDANETATLKYCTEHFDKVIVIINSPAPMELGFLDDPDHYAYSDKIVGALWSNLLYNSGWQGLVDCLTGKINPSGHLPDTYARDFKADPTWNNFGNNAMENYSEDGADVNAKGNQYANDNMHGTGDGYYSNYVYYKEGIYSGYRYWETRGYTEGLETQWTGTETDVLPHNAHSANEAIHYYSKTNDADKIKQTALDGKTWDNWYDAHVVYPFGYGLSYTDFTWTLESISDTFDTAGKITAKVKVTNKGTVAGKDVVQLYYNAPYINGGIEKSHVSLGAFAKTKLIQPNESDTVMLEFAVRDMASYDYNDKNGNEFEGYELDAGTYNIYIGENAHCWADPNVLTKAYTLDTDVKYETDGKTTNKVENRFDEVSEQLLHEDRYPEDAENNQKDMYMSRANFADTYPTLSYRLTAEQWIIDGLKEYNDIKDAPFGAVNPEDKETDPWYDDTMPVTGAVYDTPIQLKELFGLDYEDGKWDLFLDQLTVEQLTTLAMKGAYTSGMDIPELGVTKVHNKDAASRLIFDDNPSTNVQLPNDIITAATWNTELAYRRGILLGNLSLWGGKNVYSRVPGWYAPAVNVHRNPFGGRVGEYFSEDGMLTGKMSAQIVIGAQEKGMFCYVKHFAVNSQETNRCGLITWADEQTMREVYFKPFEICVKEGKTLAMMSSLNRLGPRWAGGSYALLTEILRDEWGFRGSVVTDSFGSWSNADIMIRAGGSLVLGNGQLAIAPQSATTVNLLRNCAHDILYAHANSMAINEMRDPIVPHKISKFNNKELDIGTVGLIYNVSIADCIVLNNADYSDLDISEVTFALDEAKGELPKGLSLSADGVISGTPEEAANLAITIIASYGTEKTSRSFALSVIEGSSIIYNTQDAALIGFIGSAVDLNVAKAKIFDPNASFTDTAKFPVIKYSLANGSLLPEGLVLGTDGRITGMPAKECRDYEFEVIASAIGYSDARHTFSISLLYKLSLENMTLASGKYGKSYVQKLIAESDAEVAFELKDGSLLPNGLTLTESGYIVGIPTEAGEKKFTVVAKSDYAQAVEREYTIKVDPSFDTTTELASGKVGEAYLGSVATAQGSFDITYKIVGGSLPAGLTLNADGTISGTPQTSGVYTIVVRAEDGVLADETVVDLFVDGIGSVTTVVKGEKNAAAAVAIALGVTAGVFAAGFAVMTVLFVSGRKNKKDN